MEEHEPVQSSSKNQPRDSQKNIEDEDIGLLVVHGVGEQCQFEHLQEVAKKLALALENDSPSWFHVYIQINKCRSGPLGAKQETWNAQDGAPIVLHLRDTLRKKTIRFHLQEVWWADIDPPSSLRKIIEFWFWGLSLWNTRGFTKSPILGDPENKLILAEPISSCLYDRFRSHCLFRKLFAFFGCQEASRRTDGQQGRRIALHVRLEYFGIAILFTILQPILAFFDQVFHVLGSRFPIDVFSQYMSKIRLYQRRGEKGQGHLQDLNSPPRFTIRRRMIAGLVKMATSDYDRWYIMAHSLGAIVAFNGLSEPEHSLVNYLDEATWNLARDKKLHEPGEDAKANTPDYIKRRMKPSRPPWLKGIDRIYRHKLFKDLDGLVTYGGAFRHFVDLWPGIMLCHNNGKDKDFNKKFQWFNIYDPSDPVATVAKEIFPTEHEGIKPIDIAYKAPKYHLLSHVSYLNIDKNSKDTLVHRLLSWMKDEIPDLNRSTVEESSQSQRWSLNKKNIERHRVFRYLTWWILGYIGALFISFFSIILLMLLKILRYLLLSSNSSIISELSNTLNLFNYSFSLAWVVVSLAIGLAFVMGIGRRYILGRILGRNRPVLRIKDFLADKANSFFTLKEISSNFDYTEKEILNSLNRLMKDKVIRFEKELNKYVFPNHEIMITSDAFQQLHSILQNYQEKCHSDSCNKECPISKYCSEHTKLRSWFDLVLNEIKFEPNIQQNKELGDNKIQTVEIGEKQEGETQISCWLLVITPSSKNEYIWYIKYGIRHKKERYRDPMIFITDIELTPVQE
jgi:hypothetical protein